MEQERYIVGRPAVDYLTTTTFYEETFKVLRNLARSITEAEFEEANRLQYSGERAASYFAGLGNQSGKDHWMIQVSGALAHEYGLLTHEASSSIRAAKCSRVDVQVSVPITSVALRLADIGEQLQKEDGLGYGKWRKSGAVPKINLIRGGDGLDTIYIGRRSGERFFRIYVKEIEAVRFLRFEVELKGDLAQLAWGRLRLEGPDALCGLLRSELDALPLRFVLALGDVYAACEDGQGDRLRFIEGAPTWERQLRWVNNQVEPTLQKLMSTPAREDLRSLLQDLLDNF